MAESRLLSNRNKIILVVAAILIIAGGYWWQVNYRNRNWITYKDSVNKVQFSYPRTWSVGSSVGFVSVLPDATKPDNLNMLIKVNQPQAAVDYFNLGAKGEKVTIGEKTLTISHREITVADGSGRKVTFTHLYWKDKNGRGYLFEISPWQKNGFNADMIRILKSFQLL